MTERVWRHRFVQRLYEILRDKTGLGSNTCYDLAFGQADAAWGDRPSFDEPEGAALFHYNCLCETKAA